MDRRVLWKYLLVVFVVVWSLVALAACGSDTEVNREGESDSELQQQLEAQLQDRSFRQFEPSRDASPRKAVVIDFFSGITVWAQYAEGDYALSEWEVYADEFEARATGNGSEVTLRLVNPRGSQILPEQCDDCLDASVFSVSIRGFRDGGEVAFRLNDSGETLPSPMPVFTRWTRFAEDEYFEDG